MSNLSSSSVAATTNTTTTSQPKQPNESLVSNGSLNGHANNMSGPLFGDTEPENEKW